MRTVPRDLIPALVSAGFVDIRKIERGDDIHAPPRYRIALVCQCSVFQIRLMPIALLDRSIMAGQCPKCGVVYWSEWVSKEEKIRAIVRRF